MKQASRRRSCLAWPWCIFSPACIHVQAILAVLSGRQKTGKGRHIERALFDCSLMITAHCGLEALLLGQDPPRYGDHHPFIVPYGG